MVLAAQVKGDLVFIVGAFELTGFAGGEDVWADATLFQY
jgi:hypothetical protein